jgi:hypothetical protein
VLSLSPSNYSTWRTLFELVFSKYGIADHIFGAPRPHDPQWVQDDAFIYSWLYNRVSAEILGLVHQRNPTAANVWRAININTNPGTGNNNNGGRNGSRNRGKGKGKAAQNGGDSGGSSSGTAGTGGSTTGHIAPLPAPAMNPWTGMVHAWPMPWRPHAPGAGVLGPRPGAPSPFAGHVAQYQAPPQQY